MNTPHLLSIADLTNEDVGVILEKAAQFKKSAKPSLSGKTIINAFFEASTRTRLSFEVAAKQLGATVLNFGESGSSLEKGESIEDTFRTLDAMGPDAIVIRHRSAGIPNLAAHYIRGSVINAGDGCHEHPTQALLDLMTLLENKGGVKGLHIGIIGDVLHSRVARSNILLLSRMGAKLTLCGPPTLMPWDTSCWRVKVTSDFHALLPTLDVVMMLRLQRERIEGALIPSLGEYAQFYGLHSTERLKPSAIILHPGPVNLGVELSLEVAEGHQSVIRQQVTNGVFVRMAILELLLLPSSPRRRGSKVRST